ncbi:MAG: DUF1080 domain-containing protein, partial [Planctomycetales bacterium]
EQPLNRDSIRAYLNQFKTDASRDEKIASLISELGSEQFGVRERAMTSLRGLAMTPRRELQRALQNKDAEVRQRARRLLDQAGDKDIQRLRRVLQQVVRDEMPGFTGVLLPAIEYASASRTAAVRALVVTSSTADAALLRSRLNAESSVVREAVVCALGRHLGSSAAADLQKTLTDADEYVVLAAARNLLNMGRRSGIAALVKLLDSKRFDVRYEAVRILRFASGEKFDYRAYADDPEPSRTSGVKAWRKWAATDGKTVALRFPVKLDESMQLFNGQDLAGWQAVLDGTPIKETDVWRVKDGLLVCNGNGNGYLRTTRKFTNYRLTVEYRWPDKGGDSGVWLMMPGPDARRPTGLEVQLLSDKAGDFWRLGNFDCKVRGKPLAGYEGKIAPASEKPIGKWNVCDTTVLNGKLTVKINGVEQNNAHDCPRTPGHVALQVEGAMLDFRRIELKPLEP